MQHYCCAAYNMLENIVGTRSNDVLNVVGAMDVPHTVIYCMGSTE